MIDEIVSALRRRMIEGIDPKFRSEDTARLHPPRQGVRRLPWPPPHRVGAEDLRRYHLHLAESGIGSPSIHPAVSALRFFFTVTLGRRGVMPLIREPQRLLVVLSPDEVAALLRATAG